MIAPAVGRTVWFRAGKLQVWIASSRNRQLAKSSLDRSPGTTDILAELSISMRIGRTILTFLLALSLSMAPLSGAFAVQNDEVTASSEAVASGHDCCDHEGMPADQGMNQCQASAGCAAKCFNFYAVEFSGAALPLPIGGTKSRFASDPIHSRTMSPPFRPPRV
jgi:hypothetical protein